MSKKKMEWPTISFPKHRGEINVSGVLAAEPGLERDEMIRSWCLSVWRKYEENRNLIIDLVKKYENQ